MKPKLFFIVLFTLLSLSLWSEINNLDLEIDLKFLYEAVNSNNFQVNSFNKKFLINGAVFSFSIPRSARRKSENFKAEITIIDGEWIGNEDVVMFKCFLIFKGEEFYKYFPLRVNKEEDIIKLSDNILIIGELAGSRQENGVMYPVVNVRYFRNLD